MSEEPTKIQIETYLQELYHNGDSVQLEMEELAQARDFPIVGPLVGRALYQLALMIGAKRVFELGSGYGYSALFFAQAVGEDGLVHCTDYSVENIRLAEKFLTRANVWERVTYHQEDAIGALRRVGGIWDVIYNDINKDAYPETIDLACDHLRSGGLFISDNLFLYGSVLNNGTNASTQGIIEFTHRLLAHPDFVTTILPVRDGLAIALRQ